MTNCLLGYVHCQRYFRSLQYARINLIVPSHLEPIKHLCQMPDRGATFMNRHGKRRSMSEHQFSYCLTGNTHDICHIRQANEVRRGLDQARRWDRALDIGQGGANCLLGAARLAGEFQCQTARPLLSSPKTYFHSHSIVAGGLPDTS